MADWINPTLTLPPQDDEEDAKSHYDDDDDRMLHAANDRWGLRPVPNVPPSHAWLAPVS